MALKNIQNEHQRAAILKVLNVMNGYKSNNSMIRDGCEAFNNRMSNDEVKTQLSWLAEQGLISINHVGDYINAELTERGQDVAEGRATVPGIKRPSAY